MGQFRLLSFSTEVTKKKIFNFYLDLEVFTKKLLLQVLKNWPTIKEALGLVPFLKGQKSCIYEVREVLDDGDLFRHCSDQGEGQLPCR